MNCNECGQELTGDNTKEFGGKDEYNYRMAVKLSPSIAETFIKCDDCFEADIDQYLESQVY
jgi:hypothetical protein